MKATLYYIHDPMCSWCWGQRPLWDDLQKALPDTVAVEYVAGGLAPDSSEPMALALQKTIQGYWREIQRKLGTEFNFDFWQQNIPRRSTYIACRAVIAAKNQGCEAEMIDAIQRAYYLRALNPSETEILMQLVRELSDQGRDLNLGQFCNELESAATQQELHRQIALARELTDQGFPSMVLERNGRRHSIVREYHDHRLVLAQIEQLLVA